MEIVIKIDERLWTKQLTANDYIEIVNAVANGTPLPKGHGRLIDADKLELDDGYSNYDGYYHKYSKSQIYKAPTVLEADKEDKE